MSRWQVVVLAGTDPRGEALAGALRGLRWRVWSPGAVPLGADRDASQVEALGQCALVAVLSAQELEERAAVKVAIDGWRRDRSGTRVVPVGELVGAAAALTGLNLLERCPWTTAEAVAARLDRALEAMRARDEETVPVLVLAHPSEIVERERILAAVATRRRVEKPVEVAWADEPDCEARAAQAELVLLVLGVAVTREGAPRLDRIARSERCRTIIRRTALTARTLATCADLHLVMGLRGDDEGTDGDALVARVADQLDLWLDERFRGEGAARLHPWEQAYLKARLDVWTRGNHSGLMAIAGGSGLTRATLYVPARAAPGPWRRAAGPAETAGVELIREEHRPLENAAEDREEPAPIWLDELATHRELPAVVVEGEAGTGKTVLLQHLAALVARRALGLSSDEAQRIDWEALALGAPLLRVPILLEARRVAARLPAQASARAFAALIAEEELGACGEARTREVAEGFAEGRYLLLIDARDEAPAERLALLDQALVQLVHMHPRVRVVVATRPAAHTATRLGAPFVTLPLAPLDDQDRETLISRWCASVPTRHADRARDLPGAIAELSERMDSGGDGDRSPLDNPLFLTASLLVYELDGKLPEGRADLYDKLVEVLCRPRGPDDEVGGEQERREIAVALARAAQRAGRVALPVRTAAEAVQAARGLASVREAERRIDAMAAHTMLWRYEEPIRSGGLEKPAEREALRGDSPRHLTGQDSHGPSRPAEGEPRKETSAGSTSREARVGDGAEGRVVRPWHRSFLEHLAATGEASSGRSAALVAEDLREDLHRPAWAGCVRFLPGAFVGVHSDRGVEWITALASMARGEADPRRRGHLWALVADAVAEERARCFAGRATATGSLAARLALEVMAQVARDGVHYGWEDRLMLLDGLGRMATAAELGREGVEGSWLVDPRLEDPRTGTARWVEIPAGRYRLGEEGVFQSGRVRTEPIPGFYLLDTPVTAADYRPFVSGGAWRDPALRPPGAPTPALPLDWERQVRHPNRPVWGVDWWDALSFCAWASTAWRLPRGGLRVALPTAAMWEAAARGPQGDPYPWGPAEDTGQGDDARAAHDWNPTGPGPLRRAVSVGAFPRGHRGRLLDLAGNVWEWTSSPWSADGAQDGVDGRPLSTSAAPRVVRGGSWYYLPSYLRAAYRLGWLPDDRRGDLGFRVCVLREQGR